jgi:putative NIF3 family GTP cyclohydrolase 1 type 2
MYLDDIVIELDAFFKVNGFQPDLPFSRLVPKVYAGTGIGLETYLESTFLERFHGLMVRSSHHVEKVYCTVFVSDEMVEKILTRGERDVLVISHHPLVMETSGRGFLPLPEKCFVGMKDRGISLYILHTPLDVHEEISTSGSLARELGLVKLGRYYQVPGGYAGVYGRLPTLIEFDVLLERVRDVTGVSDVHFVRNRETVQTIAVLGGGTNADGIRKVETLGCDALVTGTYYNSVQTEIGQRYREEFERVRGSLEISLVECSHYASEAVVMRQDMVSLCASRFGVECEFVPQDDPWY